MKITVRMLKNARACETQINRFKEVFGNSCLISWGNMIKATEQGIQWYWIFQDADFFEDDIKNKWSELNKEYVSLYFDDDFNFDNIAFCFDMMFMADVYEYKGWVLR